MVTRWQGLFLVVALLASGCQARPPAVSGQRNPSSALRSSEPEAPARHPMRKPRPPTLVGGCRERCDSPELTLASLRAALDTEREEDLVSLLEASLLRVDGEEHGARWVALWRERRLDERAADIRDQARALRARLREAAPGAPSLVGGEGRYREARLPLSDGGAVRLVLFQRGLEWLLSSVDFP